MKMPNPRQIIPFVFSVIFRRRIPMSKLSTSVSNSRRHSRRTGGRTTTLLYAPTSFCKALQPVQKRMHHICLGGVSHCVWDSLRKPEVKVHARVRRVFVAECVSRRAVALQLGTFIACVLSKSRPVVSAKKSGPDNRCAISSCRMKNRCRTAELLFRKRILTSWRDRKLFSTALPRRVRFGEGRLGLRKRGMEYGFTKSEVDQFEPAGYGPGVCSRGM